MAAYAVIRTVGHCKGRIAVRRYGIRCIPRIAPHGGATLGVVCEVAPLCGACCGMSCYTTAAHTYGALAVAYYCGGRDAASVAME